MSTMMMLTLNITQNIRSKTMSKYIFSYPVGIKAVMHIKEKTNKFVGLDDMPTWLNSTSG